MVAKALEAAGADKGKIRDEVEKMEFTGVGGVFKMAAEDHNGLGKGTATMVEIENGEWTPAE